MGNDLQSNIAPLVVDIEGQRIEILDKFNSHEPANFGRPYFWSLDVHIAAVIQLITSDEIEMALKLIDQIPAWHREKYPERLREIKKTLYKNLYSVFNYSDDDEEAGYTREDAAEQWMGNYCFPRAAIITDEVKRLNAEGKTPWLFDLSCSHGNLPTGLQNTGAKFNYFGKSMNKAAELKVKEWMKDIWLGRPLPGQETILINTEALEHAWREEDIVQAAYQMGIDYDQIILSTPLGCLFQGLSNWQDRRLGHIRGYTEREFLEFADKHFPGYVWKYYRSYSQVAHGKKQ